MMNSIAKLHIAALPHTWTSKRGASFVSLLYSAVKKLGYVKTVEREGQIVGVISGIAKWVLTLAVDPGWQRRGIGRELIEGLGGGRLYVYTEEHNRGFYEKLNFRQIFKLNKLVFLWRK